MTEKKYEPKGKILRFLEAVKAEPQRVFTSAEVAHIMRTTIKAVSTATECAIREHMVFRAKRTGYRGLVFSGTPFADVTPAAKRKHPERPVITNGWATDPDDPRIQKVVPGWKPPQMVCTRSGA